MSTKRIVNSLMVRMIRLRIRPMVRLTLEMELFTKDSSILRDNSKVMAFFIILMEKFAIPAVGITILSMVLVSYIIKILLKTINSKLIIEISTGE